MYLFGLNIAFSPTEPTLTGKLRPAMVKSLSVSPVSAKKEYVKLCPLCDNPGEVENIITVTNSEKVKADYQYFSIIEETYEPVCCCNIL